VYGHYDEKFKAELAELENEEENEEEKEEEKKMARVRLGLRVHTDPS